MQEELTALQPELIQTSAETDKMMLKIEAETVDVDAKKKLVSADEKVANEAAAKAKNIKVYIYIYIYTYHKITLNLALININV